MNQDNIYTLTELLLDVAGHNSADTWLVYAGREYTYSTLVRRARHYAACFQQQGLRPGDRVALILDNSPGYMYAFFGTLLCGGIAVAVSPGGKSEHAAGICRDAGVRLVVLSEHYFQHHLLELPAEIKIHTLESIEQTSPPTPRIHQPAPGDTAYLQYTSGTTGFAKGVMVSHGAILANIRALFDHLQIDRATDVFSSLLPLYHDMGLVGFGLAPIFYRTPLVLYHQNIISLYKWLEGFATYRVTISGASNSLLYLTRRVVSDPSRYDLSSLRILICGSEPLYPDTLRDFEQNYRLNEVIVPAYGLAECTLCVTMAPTGRPFKVDQQNIVCCGPPLPGVEVKIDATPGASAGEILVSSPALMSGYFRKPEQTARVLTAGFLRTGDLGYLDEAGELYVLGRIKNIIIRDGENLIPGDLEQLAVNTSRVKNAAVFGQEKAGRERIVLVCEVSRKALGDATLLREIRQEIQRKAGVSCNYQADHWYFVPPGTIPFSPNGKLQHQKLKQMLLTAGTTDHWIAG